MVVFLFLSAPNIFVQSRAKTIQIYHVENPLKIDGIIEDSVCEHIQPASQFFLYDPINGLKVSEETFMWAAYDQNNLYFAFLMKDSMPEKI